jgi:Ca-activated chloride channel family protein
MNLNFSFQRFLQVLILTLIVIATVFRPYWGTTEQTITAQQSTVIIALDISKSMNAQDTAPSRLERAKRVAQSIIESTPPNQFVRYGLVLFAGSASLFTPPTIDRDVLQNYLQTISNELIVDEGSNFIEAIEVSRQSLKDSFGAIVIVSDGEVAKEDSALVLERASKSSIPIFTISIGTETGSSIPDGNQNLVDDNGMQVLSKANPGFLSELSGKSPNGSLLSGSEITAQLILDTIKKTPTSNIKKVFKNEIGYLFFTAALLIIAVAIFRYPRFLLPLLFIFFLDLNSSFAESLTDEVTNYNALQNYQAKEYSEASKKYQSLASTYNGALGLGATAFREGRFKDALSAFDTSNTLTHNQNDAFKSYYNGGNAALSLNQFDEAIKRYDEALKINSKDERAITNRRIAIERKQEEQKQQEQNKDQSNKDQSEKNQDSKNQENKNNQNNQEQQDEKKNQSENTPQDNQQKDEPKSDDSIKNDKPDASPTPPEETKGNPQEQDGDKPETPDEKIAKNWINSLPEAPLLIKRGQQKSGVVNQRW